MFKNSVGWHLTRWLTNTMLLCHSNWKKDSSFLQNMMLIQPPKPATRLLKVFPVTANVRLSSKMWKLSEQNKSSLHIEAFYFNFYLVDILCNLGSEYNWNDDNILIFFAIEVCLFSSKNRKCVLKLSLEYQSGSPSICDRVWGDAGMERTWLNLAEVWNLCRNYQMRC